MSHDVTGLTQNTPYYARLRYRDDSGAGVNEWSDWSASDSFTTADTPEAPAQPTCTVDTIGGTGATLHGDAFSDPDAGASHAQSQWQVDVTAGDFSSPVVDDTSGSDLVAHPVTGLSTGTGYQARVRYQDDTGLWSAWSAAAAFTTTGPPVQPVLSLDTILNNQASFTGSAYSDPEADPHAQSQWQVALASDPSFSAPPVDVTSATELVAFDTGEVLDPLTAYLARVSYQDDTGLWSAWSDAVAFTTLVDPTTRVTQAFLAATVTTANPLTRVSQLMAVPATKSTAPPTRVTQLMAVPATKEPNPPTRVTQLMGYAAVRSGCVDTLYSRTEKLILGSALGGGVYELGRGLVDGVIGTPTYLLRTRDVAPAGEGGEAATHNLYVVLTWTMGCAIKVTPIVDGRRYGPHYIGLSPSETYRTDRFEIGISQPHDESGSEVARTGVRGTWFAAELELGVPASCDACGDVIFEEIELEWDAVTEGLQVPGYSGWTTYTSEDVQAGAFVQPSERLILGAAADGSLLDLGRGYDDDGADLEAILETNWVAPAGSGGECSFHNLYLVLTRTNVTDAELLVYPIVDGVEQEAVALTLSGLGADKRVDQVFEVPLSEVLRNADGSEAARFAQRGVWFAARVVTSADTPLADGDLLINGIVLEHEVVTESEPNIA